MKWSAKHPLISSIAQMVILLEFCNSLTFIGFRSRTQKEKCEQKCCVVLFYIGMSVNALLDFILYVYVGLFTTAHLDIWNLNWQLPQYILRVKYYESQMICENNCTLYDGPVSFGHPMMWWCFFRNQQSFWRRTYYQSERKEP